MNFHIVHKLTLMLAFFAAYANLSSQAIYHIDTDNSKYPLVTNSFYLLDNNYDVISTPNDTDFEIMDQGIKYSVWNNIPGSFDNQKEVSLLITVDLGTQSDENFEYAKLLTKSIISEVAAESEIALSSFDIVSMMNQDFTKDKALILSQLNLISRSNYSDYRIGLKSMPFGAEQIFSAAKFAKKIILITDNHRNLGNSDVIADYANQGIELIVVNVERAISEDLRAFSKSTNGVCFDRIKNDSNPAILAKLLVKIAYGLEPIKLTHKAILNCDEERVSKITYLPLAISMSNSYKVNVAETPNLIKQPEFIGFSSVVPNKFQINFKDEEIKLTAKYEDILIDSIYLLDDFNKVFEIIEGKITSKTLLAKDAEHLIKLRYAPFDSAIVFTKLVIVSNSCSNDTILITGGFPNTPPNKKTIEIVYPNCEETLVVGDTVTIKWTGLLPKDVVQLEYSLENGKSGTWKPLASDISGLEYKWLVPDEISDSVRIKIIQQWPNNIGRTLNFFHSDAVFSARFNKIGDEMVTASNNGEVVLWNANTGSKLMVYGDKNNPDRHLARVTWAEFSPNEKLIVSASNDKTIKIWNKETGELIKNLTNHTDWVSSARFSYDGQLLVSTSWDRTVKIWRTDTWEFVSDITPDPIYKSKFASFSKDNKSIAVAIQSGFVKIYEVGTWKEVMQIDAKESKPVAQLEFVDFSPDSQKIMVTNITTPKLNVYEVKSKKMLYELNHTPKSAEKQEIKSASYYIGKDRWGNDVERILTAGSDGLVVEWNGVNGDSLRIYKEHSSVVFTAQYNFDGTRVLTASADSTAKIWKLDSNFIQIDTTDCTFRIKKAQAGLADVHFGNVIDGRFKDSTLKAMITNDSDFDLEVRGLSLINNDNAEFAFLEDSDKIKVLPAKSSKEVEMTFNPKGVGLKTANIRLQIPGKILENTITANSISESIVTKEPYIDFSTVEIGEFADMIGSYFVNKDMENVRIDSIRVVLPNTKHFALTKKEENKVLATDATVDFTVRFTPENIFRQNGTIEIIHSGNNSPSKIAMKGLGVVPRYDTARIEVNNISAKAGDIIELPVYLRGISSLGIQKSITGIQSELTFNGTLLQPIDGFISTITNGVDRTVFLKYNFPSNFEELTKNQSEYKLGTIRFKVGLGNDSISPLSFANTAPLGKGKIILSDTSKAQFDLLGFCNAGTPRLFKETGLRRFLMQNYPNPVSNDLTTIQFSLLEEGNSQLIIYDASGRLVKEVFSGELRVGEYEIDVNLADLPNGTYTYVLKLPTKEYSQRLQVIR